VHLFRSLLPSCLVLVLVSSVSTSAPAADRQRSQAPSVDEAAELVSISPVPDDVAEFFEVSPDLPVRRVTVGAGAAARFTSATGPLGTLVYSNTQGNRFHRPRSGLTIADDLFSIALDDFELAGYALRVSGGGDGTGAGFTLDVALLDGCPESGARTLARTARRIALPDDGLFNVVVDLTDAPPTVPPAVWMSVRFDSDRAGWRFAFPSELGYSDDAYFHPFTGCNTFFGGFPRFFYAAYGAELFAAGPFDEQFIAYRSARANGALFARGAQVSVADDLRLTVETCELGAYEATFVGLDGPYAATMELRIDGPGDAIPGTRRTFAGVGDGEPERARFAFAPGILLPQRLWVSYVPDRELTGGLLMGRTAIGANENLIAVLNGSDELASWEFVRLPQGPGVVLDVTVYCRGRGPIGACCIEDSSMPATCIEDRTQLACLGRWAPDATCAERPFDPPCGAKACCLPDDRCENLPPGECATQGGIAESESLCGDAGQRCTPFACRISENGCASPHDSPGCVDTGCCDVVCTEDPWCCEATWDSLCVVQAVDLCSELPGFEACPSLEVEWLEPPAGVIDARQPHAIADETLSMGIDRIVVRASGGVPGAVCWTLCESTGETDNAVVEVRPRPGLAETFDLRLRRAITPGGRTTLTYTSDDGTARATAAFAALPGDVNADGVVSVLDLSEHISCCLNRSCEARFGLWSCDIDAGGGGANALDLTRLIDLFNGAGGFSSWVNSTIEQSVSCP